MSHSLTLQAVLHRLALRRRSFFFFFFPQPEQQLPASRSLLFLPPQLTVAVGRPRPPRQMQPSSARFGRRRRRARPLARAGFGPRHSAFGFEVRGRGKQTPQGTSGFRRPRLGAALGLFYTRWDKLQGVSCTGNSGVRGAHLPRPVPVGRFSPRQVTPAGNVVATWVDTEPPSAGSAARFARPAGCGHGLRGVRGPPLSS